MTRRVIGVVVALLMFAACGSGSKKSASPTTSTVTHQVRVSTEPPSSVPSSTSTPDTIASGGCTGQIGFAEAAGEWVASHLHITETLTVAGFRRSRVDSNWATARLVGPKRTAVVVAHCGTRSWRVATGVGLSRAVGVVCAYKDPPPWPADVKPCP